MLGHDLELLSHSIFTWTECKVWPPHHLSFWSREWKGNLTGVYVLKRDPQNLCKLLSTSKSQSGSESVSSSSKLAATLWARACSWNSGRVGLADGLARCCSDSGRGKTVALWRATTDELRTWAWGLEMWQSGGEVFPVLKSYLCFCGYCCWPIVAYGRYLHSTLLSVQSHCHWISFYKLHLLI